LSLVQKSPKNRKDRPSPRSFEPRNAENRSEVPFQKRVSLLIIIDFSTKFKQKNAKRRRAQENVAISRKNKRGADFLVKIDSAFRSYVVRYLTSPTAYRHLI